MRNTERSYGAVSRLFHWLTALLILTAIPLGVVANNLPYETSEALALKAQVFSLHKTVGVAAFLVALGRILWALVEVRPVPLHPERRGETLLAGAVHWVLYISLVAVPLSGWVHHAAVTGFAPILWPFGQGLPFVPVSETVAKAAATTHWVFTKLLAASVLLHVAGALKHALVDRDGTLARMWRGTPAPGTPRHGGGHALPLALALGVYAAGAGLAMALMPAAEAPAVAAAPAAPEATVPAAASGWQVTEGRLGFTVRQMGAPVEGSFATWTAEIDFDPEADPAAMGRVRATIDMASLTLGSVTRQAVGPEFFDVAAHPTAVFAAAIRREGEGYLAEGTLTLRGVEKPLTLPFTLALEGESARMEGRVSLDRRDFGIGAAYPDEGSVGFAVEVAVSLTALRQ